MSDELKLHVESGNHEAVGRAIMEKLDWEQVLIAAFANFKPTPEQIAKVLELFDKTIAPALLAFDIPQIPNWIEGPVKSIALSMIRKSIEQYLQNLNVTPVTPVNNNQPITFGG